MPDKISKKIKFALYLKNDEEVRTLEEFYKYFDMSEVIRYFLRGKLSSWLRNHNYPEEKCRAIEQLKKNYDAQKSKKNTGDLTPEEKKDPYKRVEKKIDTLELVEKLSKILEISESDKTNAENLESVNIIEDILEKESDISDHVALGNEDEKEEILKDVEKIALTQDDLNKIIEKSKRQKKSATTIYLVKKRNPYLLNKEDVFNTNFSFIGLNRMSSENKVAEIKILDASSDRKASILDKDKDNILDEEEIKSLLNEPQNKNKFNNLEIITCKINYFTKKKEPAPSIIIPKTKIKSSNTDVNKTGIEIAEDKLIQYLDAGFPLIYIDNLEEDKADEIIRKAAVNRSILEWNEVEGLVTYDKNGELSSNFDRQWSLKNTLKFFIDDFRYLRDSNEQTHFELKSSVLVLKDMDDQLNDFEVISQLKYLSRMIYNGQIEDCNIIIVSSNWNIPPALEHYVTVIKIDLTEKEIYNLVVDFCKNQGAKVPSEILIKKFVEAFKGLSEFTIISILSLAFSRDGELNSTDMDLIFEIKKQMIQKTNILEMVEVTEKEEDIGGLETLKAWLNDKEKIFKNMSLAIKCGIKLPKGILIVGMPGCGKTLTAKVTASMFDMPLLRLDMGRIFGKYVGESEKNMRRAIQQAEVISPCILWIDELEKAFAGVGGDGGAEVATRLFGTFLTWMQEKTKPVFVVATANNVSQLPPELLRKGRFDEIFYVGTPNALEREKIFKIYIDKVKNNKEFSSEPESKKDIEAESKKEAEDIEEMVQNSLGFSSADIAGIVISTVESSFVEFVSEKNYVEKGGKPVFNTEMILDVMKKRNPISFWQQIKRIYQTYLQNDYKNASERDAKDFLYWFKLRVRDLKALPGKIFSVTKSIFVSIWKLIHDWASKRLDFWSKKVAEWDIQERQIKEQGLPKLKWHFRFCRTVVRLSVNFSRKLNNFLMWLFPKGKETEKETEKEQEKVTS